MISCKPKIKFGIVTIYNAKHESTHIITLAYIFVSFNDIPVHLLRGPSKIPNIVTCCSAAG